jgi:hypothetical protein
MRNQDIRMEIKASRLFYHEVAEKLKMHESSLYRLLRSHLTTKQKQDILTAIQELKQERFQEMIQAVQV